MLALEKEMLGTLLSSATTSGSWRGGWRSANGRGPHEGEARVLAQGAILLGSCGRG